MDGGLVKRVEKKFFFESLVYVRNQVVSPHDMLMAAIQQQVLADDDPSFISVDLSELSRSSASLKKGSSRRTLSPRSTFVPSVDARGHSPGGQWSVASTYKSRPPDDFGLVTQVSSGKNRRRVMKVRRCGGTDEYDSFFGFLSLRDTIFAYSLLFGVSYGSWLMWEGLQRDSVAELPLPAALGPWPQTWRQLGLSLFGGINICCGLLGIATGLSQNLVCIHCHETLVSATLSALIVEAVTKIFRITVQLVFQRVPWAEEDDAFLQTILINLAIALLDIVWYLGIIRSYRSVVVAGGRGTEFQPWFELLKKSVA